MAKQKVNPGPQARGSRGGPQLVTLSGFDKAKAAAALSRLLGDVDVSDKLHSVDSAYMSFLRSTPRENRPKAEQINSALEGAIKAASQLDEAMQTLFASYDTAHPEKDPIRSELYPKACSGLRHIFAVYGGDHDTRFPLNEFVAFQDMQFMFEQLHHHAAAQGLAGSTRAVDYSLDSLVLKLAQIFASSGGNVAVSSGSAERSPFARFIDDIWPSMFLGPALTNRQLKRIIDDNKALLDLDRPLNK